MTTWPAVSVLLLQHGNADLTRRALEAARRSLYTGPVELLVYDNGSPDPSARRDLGDDVTLVVGEGNIGFGPATNELAHRASGELLLLLNNDTILTPGCLRRMVERLTADPPAAAVAALARGFDGRVLEAGVVLGPTGDPWQLFRGEEPPVSYLHQSWPVDYGSAACLLLRRLDFLEAGGFDDLFAPAYFEDVDLCLRLARSGRQVFVEPGAVVYHVESATSLEDGDLDRWRLGFDRKRGQFLLRWAAELEALPPAGLAAGLRRALGGDGGRGIVLWLVPELPRRNNSGGDARLIRAFETLRQAGFAICLWCDQVTDHTLCGTALEELGVLWLGAREPVRWPLARRTSCLDDVDSVLRLGIWDLVIASWPGCAAELAPHVRALCPKTPFLVDSVALHYLQGERGGLIRSSLGNALQVSRDWELGVYAASDGVIAGSVADAEAIRSQLPSIPLVTFDVGAYNPTRSPRVGHQDRLVFLGNFLHPPNLDAVAWWVEEIAPALARLGCNQPLRVIGSGAELVLDGIGRSAAVEVVGWVEDLETELGSACAFIAPLRFGAGTKDKLSLSLRYGLPTVTTPIGAESMPRELAAALVVEQSPAGLARAVHRLLHDGPHWENQCRRSRRAADSAWKGELQARTVLVDWLTERVTGAPG